MESCLQTYEGGLGGEPGNEAHGGYTFCGLAALVLAGRADVLDLPALLRWVVWRQVGLQRRASLAWRPLAGADHLSRSNLL